MGAYARDSHQPWHHAQYDPAVIGLPLEEQQKGQKRLRDRSYWVNLEGRVSKAH